MENIKDHCYRIIRMFVTQMSDICFSNWSLHCYMEEHVKLHSVL